MPIKQIYKVKNISDNPLSFTDTCCTKSFALLPTYTTEICGDCAEIQHYLSNGLIKVVEVKHIQEQKKT